MLVTVSIEKAQELMEKALKDYAESLKKGVISLSIDAGIAVGTFNFIKELDGFPEEKLREYHLRISGIGELHSIAVSR